MQITTAAITSGWKDFSDIELAIRACVLERMIAAKRGSAEGRLVAAAALAGLHAEIGSRWEIATAVTSRCESCEEGCRCQRGAPGCGHFCCWGDVPAAERNTCPAATAPLAVLYARSPALRLPSGCAVCDR